MAEQTPQTDRAKGGAGEIARLNDWLTVQPDMQYIARPSGIQRDSLVVGLQVEIIL